MDDNIMIEIINEVSNSIYELGDTIEDFLQKIAYVECLKIIKTTLTGHDLSKYGLDVDLDKKLNLIK